jgi:acyl-CoA-binding protein
MAAKGKEEPLPGRFAEAAKRVERLEKRPSNDELLALYGFYKQATEGDVTGARPGMFDMKGRAKHDAWASRKGVSKGDAMKKYIALVDQLEQRG